MSIKLTTGDRIAVTSSKGNQEKWLDNGRWYKLDLFGYEGLAETVSSSLLAKTNMESLGFRYVTYRMERLEVHRKTRNGCSSANFLRPGESILTLSDLFRKGVGPDWQRETRRLPNLQSHVRWMTEQVQRLTCLDRFGIYLTLLFEVDMLFGNEDRHLNNIAVLRRGEEFDYCPIFDFGAGLLSNVRDDPMDIEPKALLHQLRARPLNTLFARQVHAAQAIYGPQLECDFTQLTCPPLWRIRYSSMRSGMYPTSGTGWRRASGCSGRNWPMRIPGSRQTALRVTGKDQDEIYHHNAGSIYPHRNCKIVQDQKGLRSLSATLHSIQELPAKEYAALGEHGDLMGYVHVNGYGSSALELEVGIAPKYRRQGYGRELLRRVIQEIFCTTGAERLVYRVRPDNIASIRLIGSLGGVLQEPDSVAEKL